MCCLLFSYPVNHLFSHAVNRLISSRLFSESEGLLQNPRCLLWLKEASPYKNKSHNLPLSFVFFTDVILDPKKFGGVSNFSTFLLDRSSGMLFLGARDAIVSVDTNRLDKPPRNVGGLCVCVCFCRMREREKQLRPPINNSISETTHPIKKNHHVCHISLHKLNCVKRRAPRQQVVPL